MHLIPFPGCCTAGILTGFGGTETAEYRYRPGVEHDENTMFEAIKAHVEQAHRNAWAMVFATTNSDQKLANKVLPRIGFQKIEETAKLAHNEFTLLGWVFRLNPADKVAPLKVPKNPFARKDEEQESKPQEVMVNPAPMIAMDDLDEFDVDLDDMLDAPIINRLPPAPQQDNWEYVNRLIDQGAIYGHWYRSGDVQIRDLITREGTVIYEIHPNDVGRRTPELLDRDVQVRLVGVDAMQRDRRRMRDWQWNVGGNVRGAITHFCIV